MRQRADIGIENENEQRFQKLEKRHKEEYQYENPDEISIEGKEIKVEVRVESEGKQLI
jgi:hypothetical protein